MKILLSNPSTRESLDASTERYFIKAGSRWPWSYTKKKEEKNSCCFFPFFLAYTASILRLEGHEVYVYDGVALDSKEEDFLRHITDISPELLVIETATHAINYDLRLCERIKQVSPETKILLCGAHATVFASQLLESENKIDFIALGEYEFTVAELARRIEEGLGGYRMEGLGYKLGQDNWISTKKGFIEDLNTLPMPAFDLFPSNDSPDLSVYRDGICSYWPAVTLHSSRGCPFRCDFCMWNQIMYENGPYRVFSPGRVVDEMEYVIDKFGAKEIYFDDDDFCINKKHVLDICSEIKNRGLDIKWSCMGDAITTDEEMIRNMHEAGCIFMKFGVESGSKKILKNIGKPLDPEKAVRVAELCRKYGIMTHATFSFGLDGETRETMEETLKLANRIKFDTAQVSITTPFPGTRYYEKLKSKGLLNDRTWDSYDGTTACAFHTDQLKPEDIELFRKKAIRSMILHKLLDPVWFRNFLRRNITLLRNYGWKTVLEPVMAIFKL